ncbi:glutathione peroxidase [Paenibacillus sp. UNCCL117]|uniref:glutathione peroxidase n=1 Tax=unclassified Paenibacillus TaxID=185978 RepID=UPI0008872BCE|nr:MULTISPECIES: glutathione peroxidase [unclassified Paenibacillus]SDD03156.1 glutathione peroxidase [Paenibacillus sp. cl123]SFW32361.1 glutathione peroxidase [Paenibacillus sp. UNCCL117]
MSIYDFQVNTINGSPIELSIYRGKALLIVNTASRCSYSRQFADLQKLYENHKERGFEILGFPCNQFNEKEPGSNSEVRDYCQSNFGVTFPLFEKVEVRGQNAHPLFQFLTEQAPFRGFNIQTSDAQKMHSFLQEKYPDLLVGDGIKWNFTKFLIVQNGQLYGRYETTTEPFEIEPFILSSFSIPGTETEN